MKKIATIFLFLLSVTGSYSQITFSTRLEAYNNLSGAKNHSTGIVWDDPDDELVKPLVGTGFMFEGMGIKGDSVMIGDGFIYFPSITGTEGMYIEATGTDLIDRGMVDAIAVSPISSITTGSSGNRIFKIEFKNFGYSGEFEDFGTTKDYGNVQIWIYEKGGIMEVHYGNIGITSNAPYKGLSGFYVFVGKLNLLNQKLIGIALDGDQANPQINKMNNALVNGVLIGHPELGRVYKFEIPASASTESINQLKARIYPQPACDFLNVELAERSGTTNLKIHSISGELISDGILENGSIDIRSFRNGLYVLTIEQNGIESHRLFQKM